MELSLALIALVLIALGVFYLYENKNSDTRASGRSGTSIPSTQNWINSPAISGRILTPQEEALAREGEKAAADLAQAVTALIQEARQVQATHQRLLAELRGAQRRVDCRAARTARSASINVADRAFTQYSLAREKKRVITGLIDKYRSRPGPMLDQLGSTRVRLQVQIDKYLAETKVLNANTHTLKVFIEENCSR